MSDDRFDALAQFLTVRDGTVVHPKGDGRVEIPHSVVRLMGWRDKSIVSVGRGNGCLVVSEEPPSKPIGRIAISMERARIPMSMLRSARMGGEEAVVIVPCLTDRYVTVWPSLCRKRSELAAVLRTAGPEICNQLARILMNEEQRPEEQQEVTTAPVAPEQQRDNEPKLFVMDTTGPMVVRVIGRPFGFQSHWVPVESNTGRIVPHSADCSLCGLRTSEHMSLIPVIRKKNGEISAGFLLAQEALKTKIAHQLSGRNPTGFDLVLYYVPFSEGMCSVYKSPPEEMPESQIEAAQAVCCDPNMFVAKTFGEPANHNDATPAKAPMLIVEGNFATDARPHNLVK